MFVVSVVGSGAGLVLVLVSPAGVSFIEGGIVVTICSCVVVVSGVVVVAVSRSGVGWTCIGVLEGARFGLLMYSTSLFTFSSSRLLGLLLLMWWGLHALWHCEREGGGVVSIGVGSTSKALKMFGEVGGESWGLPGVVGLCQVLPVATHP